MRGTSGAYSREWYATFLDSISTDVTEAEVAFVERQMPSAQFPSLLDLGCGPGRHAASLSGRGYRVLGIDTDTRAIERARASCPGASFHVGDMRELSRLAASFDAVVSLWHGFGYYDDATNQDVLRQVRAVLRRSGRALLDVFNRDHFAQRPSEEFTERAGRRIRIRRSWTGLRERVTLEYDGLPGDEFEWRLYSPIELQEECASVGLATRLACARFDESLPPSAEHARLQLVLERT